MAAYKVHNLLLLPAANDTHEQLGSAPATKSLAETTEARGSAHLDRLLSTEPTGRGWDSGDLGIEVSPTANAPSSSPDVSLAEARRSTRPKKRSGHLSEFICNSSCSKHLSIAATFPRTTSGTKYPLINYVTCDNFSKTHKHFLAAITTIVEPRYCKEAATDPLWRQAMTEEIRALEENKT